MIFSRYIRNAASGALALLLAASLAGCASEEPSEPTPADDGEAQLVINLKLPNMAGTTTRSVPSAPTTEELSLNALRIVITDSKGDVAVNRPLMIPANLPVDPDRSEMRYEFKGFKQDEGYKIFVVGNLPHDAMKQIDSETKLREYIMDYSKALPTPGNLPIIYEETEAETFRIAADATEPIEKSLKMKFACVKMKINLIFDKSYKVEGEKTLGSVYGEQGFAPQSISLSNVTEKVPLLINGNRTKVTGARDINLMPLGTYYTDWTYTKNNMNTGNDVVTPGTKAEGFASYADNWLWHTEIYLPERYSSTDADRLQLVLTGNLTDKDGNRLQANVLFAPVKIGVEDTADGVTASELPRGSYYEFIGHIASRNLDSGQLEIYVKGGKWTKIPDTFDF